MGRRNIGIHLLSGSTRAMIITLAAIAAILVVANLLTGYCQHGTYASAAQTQNITLTAIFTELGNNRETGKL